VQRLPENQCRTTGKEDGTMCWLSDNQVQEVRLAEDAGSFEV
jgi:hypothetical protein